MEIIQCVGVYFQIVLRVIIYNLKSELNTVFISGCEELGEIIRYVHLNDQLYCSLDYKKSYTVCNVVTSIRCDCRVAWCCFTFYISLNLIAMPL